MPRKSASRFARIAGSSAITITSSKKRSTAGFAVASAFSAGGEVAAREIGVDGGLELLEGEPQVVLGAVFKATAIDGGRGVGFGLLQDVDDPLVRGGERARLRQRLEGLHGGEARGHEMNVGGRAVDDRGDLVGGVARDRAGSRAGGRR